MFNIKDIKNVKFRAKIRAFMQCFNPLFYFEEIAAESYIILQETYGEHALSQETCEHWFKRFKSDDFNVKDKNVQANRKKFKNNNCKGYWMKMRVKHKNN